MTSSSPEIQYVECRVFPRSRKGVSKENVHAMHWPSHLHKLLEFVDSTASSSRLEAVAIEVYRSNVYIKELNGILVYWYMHNENVKNDK